MGTSTLVDALGDTLTLPGVVLPPAAPAEQSGVSVASEAGAPPVRSDSDTECRTLESGDTRSGETGDTRSGDSAAQGVPSSSPATASVSPAELGAFCLSDDVILQYRQGELNAAQLEAIDVHLDGCVRCRELVELVIAERVASYIGAQLTTCADGGELFTNLRRVASHQPGREQASPKPPRRFPLRHHVPLPSMRRLPPSPSHWLEARAAEFTRQTQQCASSPRCARQLFHRSFSTGRPGRRGLRGVCRG